MESRYVLRQVFEERLREVLAVEGEPSQEAMAAAARSFDAFARESLRASGWPPAAKSVAAILEVHLPDYYVGLQGRRMSVNRLLVWYAKWAVIFTSGRQSALPADLPKPVETDGTTETQVPTIRSAITPPSEEGSSASMGEVWIRLDDGRVLKAHLSEVPHARG